MTKPMIEACAGYRRNRTEMYYHEIYQSVVVQSLNVQLNVCVYSLRIEERPSVREVGCVCNREHR